uniref:Transketolase n=1 Tax=uncultured bacterium contig00056 TaxID=1181540 RepID=A0A806KNS6_9BACT|nr:transketolase [uncultured bacterium contig00056]
MAEQTKEMRMAYVDTIVALAEKNKNIVVLEADLMSCTGTAVFKKAYPDRFFNCGIAEANMVGIAAGLSTLGKIPFAAGFGCFSARRVFDQFFLSANYAKLNVKLIGTDPGVTAAFNGGTHMPFEELALMRVVPKLTVIEPSDPVSCAALVKLMAEEYGCHYLRIPRKPVPYLYPENETFKFGQAKLLKEGKDVCFVALGSLMVNQSLKACEALAAKSISAGVLDVLTLKPIDKEAILAQAGKVRAIISAENAQIAGGLGSAVAEILSESGSCCKCKFARIGIKDEFGEVGTQDYLVDRFGLDVGSLVKKAEALLG